MLVNHLNIFKANKAVAHFVVQQNTKRNLNQNETTAKVIKLFEHLS